MAFITADRVLDSSTSTGTGPFVVSGTPAAGYQTFSAVMSVGDTCYYSIQGQTTSEWEVGLATYSAANTLTRTTIYSSSNAGSAVTFSAGTKDVFITMAASRSVQLDASGNVTPATGTYTRTTITATAGQTSFTASYTVNYVEVYVNGILLNSADYTATTGTTVVLASAAAAGDIVDVVAINIGTFTGGVTITGTPASGQIAAWTGSTSIQGIAAPTTAGNTIFTTDGTNWSSTQKIVQGTSVSASGTSIPFTGIPAWVKRITIAYQSLSTSGTSLPIVQLGTGGTPTYTSSGYLGAVTAVVNAGASVGTTFSSGFAIVAALPNTASMQGFLTLINLTGNTWVAQSSTGRSDAAGNNNVAAGSVSLAAALTAVRLTMVNGTDTFDAGSVNILYE